MPKLFDRFLMFSKRHDAIVTSRITATIFFILLSTIQTGNVSEGICFNAITHDI